VLGEELRPGLWRWTAHHPDWKRPVASFALERDDEVALVDPQLEASQWGQLEAGLGGRPPQVLLTIHWHTRSAAAVAERFAGTRIWANSRNRAAVARRAPVTDVFRPGDPLPAGLQAFAARPRSEVLFWDPVARALIAGDALLGDGEHGEGLHTCPPSWLPESTDLGELRAALRELERLPIELVLVSHGASVLRDGGGALAQLLRDVP
jgi:glyoxylase-like metal-dependent hydrolase (beta-lactamase superfamily II)